MARKTTKAVAKKKKAGTASKPKPKRKPAKRAAPARGKPRARAAVKTRRARPRAKAARKRTPAPAKKKTGLRAKPKARAATARAKPRAKTARVRAPADRKVVVPKWMERTRAVLERERTRLADQLRDVGNFSSDGSRSGRVEVATADDDTIDMASQAVERERELALRSNLEDLLERVEKSLARISEGAYGVCERCDEKISRERLKAVPHATMCLRCRAIIDG